MYAIEEGFVIPEKISKPKWKPKEFEFKSGIEQFENKPTYIYALLHPKTNEIRYIGKTVDLKRRMLDHCKLSNKKKNYTNTWIKSLLPLKPKMIEIELNCDDWREAEIFWIAYFKSLGARLTNHSIGGSGNSGLRHSEETKRKISECNKNRSPELKLKIQMKMRELGLGQQHNKGYKHTEAAKKKMSENMKGTARHLGFKHTAESKAKMGIKNRITSEETRLKLSVAAKGRKPSDLCLIKAIEATKGKKRSAEFSAKITAANIKRFENPEARKKQSRVFTEETKAKMREAWAKRKQRALL